MACCKLRRSRSLSEFSDKDGLGVKRLVAPSGCSEPGHDYHMAPLLRHQPSRPGGASGRPRHRGRGPPDATAAHPQRARPQITRRRRGEKVDGNFTDGRSVTAGGCSCSRGEPRRPASGQARPHAHAGLSRGGCLELRCALCACVVASGSQSVGGELRACAEWGDESARKSPWVEVRARAFAWSPCCSAHADRDV